MTHSTPYAHTPHTLSHASRPMDLLLEDSQPLLSRSMHDHVVVAISFLAASREE